MILVLLVGWWDPKLEQIWRFSWKLFFEMFGPETLILRHTTLIPWKLSHPKRKVIFQASFFRGKRAVKLRMCMLNLKLVGPICFSSWWKKTHMKRAKVMKRNANFLMSCDSNDLFMHRCVMDFWIYSIRWSIIVRLIYSKLFAILNILYHASTYNTCIPWSLCMCIYLILLDI